MPKIYPEALLFCILWVALAVLGWDRFGYKGGLALSVGLFLVIMPASGLILSRTGNFALERTVRWGLLILSALALFSLADTAG